MATFTRTVPVKFNAVQFNFRGTAQETKVAATDNSELADMDYWEFFDDAFANEVKDAALNIDPRNLENVTLKVRVRWYEGFSSEQKDDTFELREGDWLVEDYNVSPIYRVMTNAQFLALGAVAD